MVLLAAADGRQLATLRDTAIVPWQDGGSRAMLAHQSAGGTDITVLDAAGAQRILGTVSGIDLTCAAASGLLICADRRGLVRAWRLPDDLAGSPG